MSGTSTAFCSEWVDRAGEKRRDAAWIAAALREPSTRFVPVWRGRNFFAPGEGPLTPLYPGFAFFAGEEEERFAFLGRLDGRAYFCVAVPDGESPLRERLEALGRFAGLRSALPVLSEKDGELLAFADSLTHWRQSHRYCGRCGHPTRGSEGGHLLTCADPACGAQHFPRTDPAIIVLVQRGDACLLGRQAGWPEKMLSTLAGFVEPGESLENTVRREVYEETGVRVGPVRYSGSQPWPFPCSLMLGFQAQAESGEITLHDEELIEAHWFTRAELRAGLEEGSITIPSKFAISYRLIEEWYDAGEEGPLGALV